MGCIASKSVKNPTAASTPYCTPTQTTALPTSSPSLGFPNLVSGAQPSTLLSMQQEIMQNPEFMGFLMNNSATRLSNPDTISALKKMLEDTQTLDAMTISASPSVKSATISLMNCLLSNPVIPQTITEQYQHLQQTNSQNPVDCSKS